MKHFACFLVVVAICVGSLWGQPGPTVGDPIALDLDLRPGERVELEPVDGIEVVEHTGNGLIVRGFRPGPATLDLVVTGENGATRKLSRVIEVASVLHEDDDLEPAPLAPPVPLPPNRRAWAAIGVAALAATFVWLQLLWAPRRGSVESRPSLSAAEELLRVIERVRRMSPSDERFATLSNASRKFLFRVDQRLGRELTSSELVDRLSGRFPEWLISDVRDILSEGDYAKFSPWGGRASRFDSIVRGASDLAVLDREGRHS